MRSPWYWLKQENRLNYAASVAVASERLGAEKVRNHLHHAGLLTPEIDAVIQRVKPTDDELRLNGHKLDVVA